MAKQSNLHIPLLPFGAGLPHAPDSSPGKNALGRGWGAWGKGAPAPAPAEGVPFPPNKQQTESPAPARAFRGQRPCRPPLCLCLLLLLCLLPLGACGGESPSPQPPAPAPAETPSGVVWGLEPGGLRCRLEASPELNRDNDTALGLTLCLYQLKEYDQFSNKAASAEGLDELLQCRPDAAQAQSARLFQLQPGATQDVVMDRAEHARYLGVVAGYTHLRPDQCAAVLPFPVHTESKGLIFRSPVYTAAPVQVLIRLGESSLSITGAERVR